MSSAPVSATPPPRSKAALIWMIVASVVYPLTALLWLLVMIGVVMGLADAPKHVGLATVTLEVYFAYPLTVLVALVAGWAVYAGRRPRGAVWAALAPLAHLLLIVLLLILNLVTA